MRNSINYESNVQTIDRICQTYSHLLIQPSATMSHFLKTIIKWFNKPHNLKINRKSSISLKLLAKNIISQVKKSQISNNKRSINRHRRKQVRHRNLRNLNKSKYKKSTKRSKFIWRRFWITMQSLIVLSNKCLI
jgi:hypothetical protein